MGETFCTLIDGEIRIYRNTDFNIVNPVFTFYRTPQRIQIAGVLDPYTGLVPAVDTDPEFKDDVIELFIDEAAAILAGDYANFVQSQRETQAAERSN
ncbi:MAG: hypothetical protein CM15mV42_0300 [uncultured marine virus]|nr:MAG: hypothetical protein CM15mV42_0300 [uncultured marine virus]